MGTALSVLVDATLITFVFALAALGLAVVFGLIGVINMGHGAMLTLGAYFTWFATTSGVPFLPSVLLAAAGVAVIGLALEHFVIRHFYDRPFETLLLTWASS
jgi:Branched-chain amino acid ABC-type transport system, permease components